VFQRQVAVDSLSKSYSYKQILQANQQVHRSLHPHTRQGPKHLTTSALAEYTEMGDSDYGNSPAAGIERSTSAPSLILLKQPPDIVTPPRHSRSSRVMDVGSKSRAKSSIDHPFLSPISVMALDSMSSPVKVVRTATISTKKALGRARDTLKNGRRSPTRKMDPFRTNNKAFDDDVSMGRSNLFEFDRSDRVMNPR